MSTQILMPALSPTMEEGKLAKWHVKEGDAVKAGDILAEIETDKATMEFEAIDEGRIGKLLVPEGAEGVKVNAPIAVLLSEGEPASAPQPASSAAQGSDIPSAMKAIRDALTPGQKSKAPAPKSPSPPVGEGGRQDGGRKGAPAQTQTTPSPRSEEPNRASPSPQGEDRKGNGAAPHAEDRIFVSPLARRIAQQSGLDLASVHGSGPRGRIVKADVEAAAKTGAAPQPQQKAAAPASRPAAEASAAATGIAPLPDARLFYKEGDYEAVPHDSMRKTIARRLTSAKALVPHYFLTVDCDIGALMQIRARLNDKAPKGEGGYKLSINDFVLKASAMALTRHPDVNASWTDAAILKHKHADIGVAVDLNPGLITPIVFHAESKGLADISNEVKSLAERAKGKKLKPQEFEGGTFSITNLGMFGIRQFTAVINPPQSAILAVGAGEERAVARDGKIVAATIMTLNMGCDHRVIDGATGSRFMQTLKAFIEEPASMLL